MDEKNNKELEDFFERLESESQSSGRTGIEKGPVVYVSQNYKKKLARKQGFLTKKGIPRTLFWAVVIGAFIISSFVFVGWPLYKNFNDLSLLLNELDELERTYYSVNALRRSKDAVIGTLRKKGNLNLLMNALEIKNEPGLYEGIKIKGSVEDVRLILEALLNDPRILIKELQLRSNLGFPIVPKTDLPTNVVLELNLNVELTNLF
ncbi:hypothetical protein AT15_09080 [Kosmotoga arenicorallina S304]|uniref:Uncharacterized protein n=1 Tax=Kosmotoga arenicorallina S304 TaxID=1453497 RepID=A0A176K136_9BACT|nr:hypothetical protein [Kosmotoga arenicorallina]OAA30826.1 hypothetical protein AT15_09080 [Kosmotoga arenicorallina S304]